MTINRRRDQKKHRPDKPASAWHAMAAAAVFDSLSTHEEGLSAMEVERRLAHHGPNRLNPPAARGTLARFFDQFRNVLIYVLLVAGAVTTAMGHLVDSGVIFGVVVINAIIGFIQEGKAERALEAVRNMLSPHAMVIRGGKRFTLPGTGCRRICVCLISATCALTRRCSPANRCRRKKAPTPRSRTPRWGTATAWPIPARWSPSDRAPAWWSPPANRVRSAESAPCWRR
jgi:hypothetical protein